MYVESFDRNMGPSWRRRLHLAQLHVYTPVTHDAPSPAEGMGPASADDTECLAHWPRPKNGLERGTGSEVPTCKLVTPLFT